MRELAAKELREVLHLDLVDLVQVEPGAAAGHDIRLACIGLHLLLQSLLLAPCCIYHLVPWLGRRTFGHGHLLMAVRVVVGQRRVYDLEGVALFGALALHMVGAGAATLAVFVVLYRFGGRNECVFKLIQRCILVQS